MRQTLQLAIISLLCLPAAARAESDQPAPGEVVGEGQAQVVSGNLVSARKRALEVARRNCVAAAVGAMVTPQQIAILGNKLSTIYRRHATYVRRYRVLEESQDGNTFRIKVAAKLSDKKLLADLSRLLKSPPKAASTAGRPRVGLWLDSPGAPTLAPQLRTRLAGLLQGHGFPTTALPALADARRLGCRILLTASVTASGCEGVRGLGRAGGKGRAVVKATLVADGGLLAEREAADWGTGTDQPTAVRAAARRALERGVAHIADVLKRRWPHRGDRGRFVRVSGLSSLRQHELLQTFLGRRVPGIRQATPWRFAGGDVWWLVTGRSPLNGLAQLLEAHEFGANHPNLFRLKLRSMEGGTVWLTVTR